MGRAPTEGRVKRTEVECTLIFEPANNIVDQVRVKGRVRLSELENSANTVWLARTAIEFKEGELLWDLPQESERKFTFFRDQHLSIDHFAEEPSSRFSCAMHVEVAMN